MDAALKSFTLKAEDFSTFGWGLKRPECVWVDREGVWTSDDRGGIARVTADGLAELRGSRVGQPNGFCRTEDGSFVVAGLKKNTVFRIDRGGGVSVVLDRIGGKPLGMINAAWVDANGRIWVSVMAKRVSWRKAFDGKPDGYIILIDGGQARVVAEGLHLPNELKVHPDGRHLYIVESLAKRVVRYPIQPNGDLGPLEVFGPADLGHGAIPDGFAFDADGNVWVTLITRNAIVVIDAGGALHTVYEEVKPKAVDVVAKSMRERSFGLLGLLRIAACRGRTLGLPTSLAFGGDDSRTVYVGSLALPHLLTFRSPVAGLRFPGAQRASVIAGWSDLRWNARPALHDGCGRGTQTSW